MRAALFQPGSDIVASVSCSDECLSRGGVTGCLRFSSNEWLNQTASHHLQHEVLGVADCGRTPAKDHGCGAHTPSLPPCPGAGPKEQSRMEGMKISQPWTQDTETSDERRKPSLYVCVHACRHVCM